LEVLPEVRSEEAEEMKYRHRPDLVRRRFVGGEPVDTCFEKCPACAFEAGRAAGLEEVILKFSRNVDDKNIILNVQETLQMLRALKEKKP
jgi:hypothetical protein